MSTLSLFICHYSVVWSSKPSRGDNVYQYTVHNGNFSKPDLKKKRGKKLHLPR